MSINRSVRQILIAVLVCASVAVPFAAAATPALAAGPSPALIPCASLVTKQDLGTVLPSGWLGSQRANCNGSAILVAVGFSAEGNSSDVGATWKSAATNSSISSSSDAGASWKTGPTYGSSSSSSDAGAGTPSRGWWRLAPSGGTAR